MKLVNLSELSARLADRLGGQTSAGVFLDGPSLRFSLLGRGALLEFSKVDWTSFNSTRQGQVITRLGVNLALEAPVAVKIFQKGFVNTVAARFLRAPAFRVGDRLFDELYGVVARPASYAERLFSPSQRSQVIASVRRLGPYLEPLIDLSRDQLVVQVSERMDHERSVLNLVETAKDFVGYVVGAVPSGEVDYAESSEIGRCPVCNARLEGDLVSCAGCSTPHHAECWRYFGKCSRFACGAQSTK